MAWAAVLHHLAKMSPDPAAGRHAILVAQREGSPELFQPLLDDERVMMALKGMFQLTDAYHGAPSYNDWQKQPSLPAQLLAVAHEYVQAEELTLLREWPPKQLLLSLDKQAGRLDMDPQHLAFLGRLIRQGRIRPPLSFGAKVHAASG